MAKSVSKEREQSYYAQPQIKRMLDAYVSITKESKSSVVNEALKEKFNSLPAQEKERLINLSKSK